MDILAQLASIVTSPSFYAAAIRLTTPILLAAMGSLFCERAGIMNIASEGWMLIGAMTAVVASYFLGDPWLGMGAGALMGVLSALVFGFAVIRIGTDQIVTAVALNIFALGATSLVFRLIFGAMGSQPQFAGLPTWRIPLLSEIPILGDIAFRQSPLVYLAFLSVPLAQFAMYRTTWGLKVRAAGESPRAVDAVGVDVYKVRFSTIVLAGLAAGLAGAFLSIGQTTLFQEGMTAGRGYIAYTAIVFGKWTPVGTLLGALVFGVADAFQLRVQALGLGLPYQFALMMPYVFTVLALVLAVGRTACPAAYGLPYRRERRAAASVTGK